MLIEVVTKVFSRSAELSEFFADPGFEKSIALPDSGDGRSRRTFVTIPCCTDLLFLKGRVKH